MKPGPHPWATNDTYAAGPDVGSDTKTQPLPVLQEDGYYRGRRPAPDLLNWKLNRSHLTQQSAARMQVASTALIETDSTFDLDVAGGGDDLQASCHVGALGTRQVFIFGRHSAAQIKEYYSYVGGVRWLAPASSPVSVGPYGALVALDADGDNAFRRIVTIDDGTPASNDAVRYNTSIGAATWGSATFLPGPPGLNWRSIGCDRDTAGAGFARWCIGDDAAGGNSALWTSADGVNFSAASGWVGPTVTEPLRGIYHSCHRAGALGTDDAGNSTWLVLSDTYASWSFNGNSWATNVAGHGLSVGGSNFGPRSAAYSMTSRRWVAALPGSAAGDIAYSDDNGMTWTTIAGALTGITSAIPRIASDGYGTFVVINNSPAGPAAFWYSVDEGMTWTKGRVPGSALYGSAYDGQVVEGAFDCSVDVDETPGSQQFFIIITYEDSGPVTEFYRSLAI